ncbi:hypothetical protein U1Q18_043809 [Sarracenia purpurea var. burkii]
MTSEEGVKIVQCIWVSWRNLVFGEVGVQNPKSTKVQSYWRHCSETERRSCLVAGAQVGAEAQFPTRGFPTAQLWPVPSLSYGEVQNRGGGGERAFFSAEKSPAGGFGITDFSVAKNHTVCGLGKPGKAQWNLDFSIAGNNPMWHLG